MATFANPHLQETILVVDDDKDMCWVLEAALAGLGCTVTTVGLARKAISLVAKHAFSTAFIDARLPDMDGLRLVEELRELRSAMRIIMISGYYLEDDVRISDVLRACKIDGFLAKPFQIDAVVAAITEKNNGKYYP